MPLPARTARANPKAAGNPDGFLFAVYTKHVQYLHSLAVAFLVFLNSVAGALGLFHISQYSIVPMNQTTPTSSQSYSPLAATTNSITETGTTSTVAAQSTPEEPFWFSLFQFHATSSSGWMIEKSAVVYEGAVDSGGRFVNRIVQSEPNTFAVSVTDPDFGKDPNNVYFDGSIIANAVPNNFIVLGPLYDDGLHDGTYAKDNAGVFYEDRATSGSVGQISDADSKTFWAIGYGYAKDDRSVYQFGIVLPVADPATFSVVGIANATGAPEALWAKDRTHVFVNGSIITDPEPDPNSVVIVFDENGNPSGYLKDKVYVFRAYDGSVVEGADPATFVVLNKWYAKDKVHVYSYDWSVVEGTYSTIGTPIEGANAASFKLVSDVSSYDATDGMHEYYQGRQI
jgi:hypothetical protein